MCLSIHFNETGPISSLLAQVLATVCVVSQQFLSIPAASEAVTLKNVPITYKSTAHKQTQVYLSIKISWTKGVGEDMGKLGPWCTAGENEKWHIHFGKEFAIPR
jgi:hypothetical protein